MQRKTPKLKTTRGIGEYVKIKQEDWPFSYVELDRLKRASEVLLELGFSESYRMSYNVIHWAHVVARLSPSFKNPSEHPDFLWLCNKLGDFFRKRNHDSVGDMVLVRENEAGPMVVLSPFHTPKKVTWSNEKTRNVFSLHWIELDT